MEKIQIVVEGLSEEQVRKDIENATKGWRLFFVEPEGVDWQFMQPFFGFKWNQTAEDLKRIILQATKIKDKHKQHICRFEWNGEDKFAWCSWTKQVYDFTTKKYYQLEGDNLARKITDVIINALEDKYIEDHIEEIW